MKKASKKPREFYVVVDRSDSYLHYGTFIRRSCALAYRDEYFGHGLKVIKVQEVLKPRRGKK